jgi:hypothetical protein
MFGLANARSRNWVAGGVQRTFSVYRSRSDTMPDGTMIAS